MQCRNTAYLLYKRKGEDEVSVETVEHTIQADQEIFVAETVTTSIIQHDFPIKKVNCIVAVYHRLSRYSHIVGRQGHTITTY